MSNELIDHVERMKQQKSQSTNNDLNTIKEGMVQDDLRTMPKEIFYEFFYPYFTGQKRLEEGNNVIAKWVEYAGNARRGVHLVDENGTIVDTVPGLISTTPIELIQNLGIDFNKLGSEYELLKGRSAEMAEAKIGKMVDEIIPKVKEIKPNMKEFKELLDNGEEHVDSVMGDDDDYIIYD